MVYLIGLVVKQFFSKEQKRALRPIQRDIHKQKKTNAGESPIFEKSSSIKFQRILEFLRCNFKNIVKVRWRSSVLRRLEEAMQSRSNCLFVSYITFIVVVSSPNHTG